MFSLETVLLFAVLIPGTLGHGDADSSQFSTRELQIRQSAAAARWGDARACETEIHEHHQARRMKRDMLLKRNLGVRQESPRYQTLQDFTCVTAPTTTEGPYYIRNELVRSNLTDEQAGFPLILDVGVVDVSTCQALPDALVEVWQANAMGLYAGYDGGAFSDTFLRGGSASNANGILEFNTIYPGYYTGRTAHIHVMVHTDWTHNNGTIVSRAGSLVHVGQWFFQEDMNSQVYSQAPYTENTRNKRTTNSQDSILRGVDSDGSYIQLELLEQGDISRGFLGYVTVVVNRNASLTIRNNRVAVVSQGGQSTSSASSRAKALPTLSSVLSMLWRWDWATLGLTVVLGRAVASEVV